LSLNWVDLLFHSSKSRTRCIETLLREFMIEILLPKGVLMRVEAVELANLFTLTIHLIMLHQK
jgi:hypothetical protein